MILHVLGPYIKVDFGALTETSHQTIRTMVARLQDERQAHSG